MNNSLVIIIGYSLDSVILARELAQYQNKRIIFYQTGSLGYPLDDINDYISYEDKVLLSKINIDCDYKEMINSRYVFMPYDILKFINSRNGLISYPLNKTSFESAEENEELDYCAKNIDKFKEKLHKSTNFINIYKKFFPKWLYDSLFKYMGINKWGQIKQSKFSSEALNKEINLLYLNKKNTGVVFKPTCSYNELCTKLLNHNYIRVKQINLSDVYNILVKHYQNTTVILCDNRVDKICNYSRGVFDRVQFSSMQETNNSSLEEFRDIENGIVLTPMKDYWCIISDNNIITKVYSKVINSLNYSLQSEIPMTINNKKIYKEYKKILNLYSGKILDLGSKITTVIR